MYFDSKIYFFLALKLVTLGQVVFRLWLIVYKIEGPCISLKLIASKMFMYIYMHRPLTRGASYRRTSLHCDDKKSHLKDI